jgi:hypothetical protein
MAQSSSRTLSFVAIALLLTAQATIASYGLRLLRGTAASAHARILAVAQAAGR